MVSNAVFTADYVLWKVIHASLCYQERTKKQSLPLWGSCEAWVGQLKRDFESTFHHYGGHVKLVQASLCVRKGIGSSFHHCRGLADIHSSFSVRKGSENSSHTVKVLKSLCAPVLELIGILTAVFTTNKKNPESSFHHRGGPVKLAYRDAPLWRS